MLDNDEKPVDRHQGYNVGDRVKAAINHTLYDKSILVSAGTGGTITKLLPSRKGMLEVRWDIGIHATCTPDEIERE